MREIRFEFESRFGVAPKNFSEKSQILAFLEGLSPFAFLLNKSCKFRRIFVESRRSLEFSPKESLLISGDSVSD